MRFKTKVSRKKLMGIPRVGTLVLLLCGTAMATDYLLYVDQGHPAASDTNAGTTPDFPVLTLSRGLVLAKTQLNSGQSVRVSVGAGIYRENYSMNLTSGSTAQSAALTVEGAPFGETIIDGTLESGFESAGWTAVAGSPDVYSHPWTFSYGLDAGSWADSLGKVPSGPALRREMLFVDDRMLMPRAIEEYLWDDPDGPGGTDGSLVYQGIDAAGFGVLNQPWTFAVADNAASPVEYREQIFMRLPAGMDINSLGSILPTRRLNNPENLLNFNNKDNLTLRNLILRRAGTRFVGSALGLNNCNNALIEDCDVLNSNGQGLGFSVDGLVMKRCRINGHGLKGAGRKFTSSSFVDCEFSYNCWLAELGDFLNFDAAGIKLGQESEFTLLKRCIAVGNRDQGLWSDVACKSIRYEECFAYGNTAGSGIFLEYSQDDPLRGDDSAYRCVSGFNQRGMQFSNARRPSATECLLVNNTEVEMRIPLITTRIPNSAATYESMAFTNNRIYNQRGADVIMAGKSNSDSEPLAIMDFGNNAYFSSDPDNAFQAAGGLINASFSQWTNHFAAEGAAGDRDATSTMTTIPDYATDPLDFEPGSTLSAIAEGWDVAVPYEVIWPGTGAFSNDWKFGSPERPGRAGYEAGSYVVVAGGTNDSGHFLSGPAEAGFDLIVRVVDVENTGPDARAGLMVRESLTSGAPTVFMAITPAGGAVFNNQSGLPGFAAPCWVRLVRDADTFDGYASSDGVSWQWVGSATVPLAGSPEAGLFVSAQDDAALCTALFDGLNADYDGTLIANYEMGSAFAQSVGGSIVAGEILSTGDGQYLTDKTLDPDPTPGGTQPFIQRYLSNGSLYFSVSPMPGFMIDFQTLEFDMQIQSGDRWVELTSSRTDTNVLWSAQSSETLGYTGSSNMIGTTFQSLAVDLSSHPELQHVTNETVFTFSYFAPPGVTDKTNWRLDNLHLAGLVYLPPGFEIGDVTVGIHGSDFVLNWTGSAAGTYTVQQRSNLVSGVWENTGENMPGLDGSMSVTNAVDKPQAFFRLLAE